LISRITQNAIDTEYTNRTQIYSITLPCLPRTKVNQALFHRTLSTPRAQLPYEFLNFISEHTANGQLQETIGSVTSSKEWQASGAETKQHAVHAMKAASANTDPHQDGYGKAEELVGKAAGCEGMEQRGAASKKE
jgi:uncharacterized protein YjbJ (UPF0337 family)